MKATVIRIGDDKNNGKVLVDIDKRTKGSCWTRNIPADLAVGDRIEVCWAPCAPHCEFVSRI